MKIWGISHHFHKKQLKIITFYLFTYAIGLALSQLNSSAEAGFIAPTTNSQKANEILDEIEMHLRQEPRLRVSVINKQCNSTVRFSAADNQSLLYFENNGILFCARQGQTSPLMNVHRFTMRKISFTNSLPQYLIEIKYESNKANKGSFVETARRLVS